MPASDLMLALRSLVRRPGFSLVVVLLLALGAGVNTAVFSIVRSVLLRPLPYADPTSLVAIWPDGYLAPEDMDYLASRVPGLDSIAGVSPGWMMALVDAQGPLKITADRVSDTYFSMLGVRASLGRTVLEGDADSGRGKVAVLSDRFWRQRYAARPDIIGQFVRIDEEAHEIVGVLPRGAALEADTDLWLAYPTAPGTPTYRQAMLQTFSRLSREVSVERVDADVRAMAPAMRDELKRGPDFARTMRVAPLQEVVVGSARPALLVLLAAVGLVLLIVVVNHGTLMLSRSVERGRELAVRTALGAGPWAVARLVLIEHLTLASLGAGIGVALAYAALPWLVRQLPPEIPRLDEISIDVPVLAVVIGVTMLLVVLFTLVPMWMSMHPQMAHLLGRTRTGDSGREHRALGLLVSAQISLAVMLGIGAGLMLRSLWSLQAVHPGFDAEHVLTLRLQSTARHKSVQSGVPYVRQVLERLSSLPGVTAVGAIQHLPLAGYSWTTPIQIAGVPVDPGGAPPRAGWRFVEGEYFAAMGVPVRVGRTFDARQDRADTQAVAIVNDTLARQHFETPADAIGHEIVMRNFTGPGSTRTLIVGVVGDVHHEDLRRAPMPEVFRPLSQVFMMTMAVVVRTDGAPSQLARAAREAVWSIDPAIPVADVQPLTTVLQGSLGRPRLIARLLVVFAATGLALTVIGVYGVAAYRVRRRQREIGVRMALGAAPAQVSALVLRQALLQTAVGVALGLPAAWGLARFMRSLLFGVEPGDLATFVALPALVVLVALVACAIPARRAIRIDPVAAIRED